jgi:hypothetical protein
VVTKAQPQDLIIDHFVALLDQQFMGDDQSLAGIGEECLVTN